MRCTFTYLFQKGIVKMKRSTASASPSKERAAAFVTCAAILIAAITLLVFSLKTDLEPSDPVYTSVLRLHIRANSDSAEDQATKLRVRDALLPFTASLFADCEDMEDAAEVARAESDAILGHIDSTLRELGAGYSARISVGREDFPERDYGGRVYPAGEYTALIVELGRGEGENWWCVLFPSLCMTPAVEKNSLQEEQTVSVGLTPDQYEVIIAPSDKDASEDASVSEDVPKYRLRFRFLELLFELFAE